jgi:hypothetical protein
VLAHVRDGTGAGAEREHRFTFQHGYDGPQPGASKNMIKILLLAIVVLVVYVIYLRTKRQG